MEKFYKHNSPTKHMLFSHFQVWAGKVLTTPWIFGASKAPFLEQHKITLRSFLSVFFMSGTKSLLDGLTFDSVVSSNTLALTGLCWCMFWVLFQRAKSSVFYVLKQFVQGFCNAPWESQRLPNGGRNGCQAQHSSSKLLEQSWLQTQPLANRGPWEATAFPQDTWDSAPCPDGLKTGFWLRHLTAVLNSTNHESVERWGSKAVAQHEKAGQGKGSP